ncbi:MAG: OmpH family outer membrane protein [Kiritimatiellae bacterium]|nr:OmpH family outer membrane protein [Kiritimatiellia bacterium]
MKRTVIALSIAMSVAAFADLKICTVNMIHLVELHPTHESNRALVKSSNEDYKAKLDAKQDALKALLDDARKIYDDTQNPMLSVSAKAEAQKKLDGMQQKVNAARQELLRSEQNYRETMNDLETRLLKMETSDIREKISAYAKEKGLDLVIDSTMAAYANDALDVTDDILRAMNVDPAKRKTLKDKAKEQKSEGK